MNEIICGDALAVLRSLESNLVHAIVTDPPAGISFMGKDWDGAKGGRLQWVAWLSEIMQEALRVLKPGGHALVWALPRTSHWTACALEDAGFEIRDKVYHLFASGFPKSYNISKGVEGLLTQGSANWTDWKNLPGERSQGENVAYGMTRSNAEAGNRPRAYVSTGSFDLKATTQEAEQWQGWGTSLKPAVEEWILCRKPLAEKNIAENVLEWECGGINIDGCRIETNESLNGGAYSGEKRRRDEYTSTDRAEKSVPLSRLNRGAGEYHQPSGRWPAHLLISHTEDCQPGTCVEGCPALELDRQSGRSKGNESSTNTQESHTNTYGWAKGGIWKSGVHYGDEGGASRFYTQFYYTPKASQSDRSDHGKVHNDHPTVKSIQLMRFLCRLITPPGGIVLDCFAGSGSTGVAAIEERFQFIGIELEPKNAQTAEARLQRALRKPVALSLFDEEAVS